MPRLKDVPIHESSDASATLNQTLGAIPVSYIADRYLPIFHYSEKHQIRNVVSTPELILSAIRNFDDRRDPVLNSLLKLRETPSRFLARFGTDSAMRERPRFGLKDFHVLEETPSDIAFGLMGRFWRPNYGLTPIVDTQFFLSHLEAGSAKLVMSYSLLEDGAGTFMIKTETRVWCRDTRARLSFLPYWLMIRPASGWIRHRILSQIKADAVEAFQSEQRQLS